MWVEGPKTEEVEAERGQRDQRPREEQSESDHERNRALMKGSRAVPAPRVLAEQEWVEKDE